MNTFDDKDYNEECLDYDIIDESGELIDDDSEMIDLEEFMREYSDLAEELMGMAGLNEDYDRTVVLNDAEGNEVKFEFLDAILYNDEQYIVLMPEENADGEVLIMRLIESEDGDELVAIEDENVLMAVFEIFRQNNEDSFEFIDEEPED